MSEQPIVVVGADNELEITLTQADATFVIAPGSTVKAALVSLDHKTKYAGDVTCPEADPAADWPNSLVMVPFYIADLADVVYQGNAILEIRVNDGTPWFGGVSIIQGRTS